MIFLNKEINLSYFKKHFILLIIILSVLIGLLYFFFIYDKKNYVDDHLSHDDDYWYYDGEWTCISFGNPNDVCDINRGICAGISDDNQKTYGKIEDQKLMVDEAIKNKNKIHDRCPIIY